MREEALELRKGAAVEWFDTLQQRIFAAFEALEARADGRAISRAAPHPVSGCW